MWLVFLCMLIAFGIERHLQAKKSAAASQAITQAVSSLAHQDESHTYDLAYKSAWIAIRHDSVSSDAIEQMLTNHHSRAEVLLFKPIQGWTILLADELPDLSEPTEDDRLLMMLEDLSEMFGEVQYFANCRTVEYYAWVKYTEGKMQRAYSYVWETMLNEGEQTRSEEVHMPEYVSEGELLPDEELVLAIVQDWSILPEGLVLEKSIKTS